MEVNRVVILVVIVAIIVGAGIYFATGITPPEKEPIVIGHTPDLTGALSAYGKGQHAAAEAAVEYINEELGGINGRPIEYVYEDSASDPATVLERTRRLIFKHDIDFLITSDSSGCIVAQSPLAKEYNVVTFTLGDSNAVSAEGNRWTFHQFVPAAAEGKALATYCIEETDARKWSIISWDYTWGHTLTESFTEYLEEKGGEVVKVVNVPLGETDMSRYVATLPEETEGVALWLYGAGGFSAVKEITSRFGDIPLTGRCVFEGVKVEKLSPEVNGTVVFKHGPIKHMEDVPEGKKDIITEYRERIGVDDRGRMDGEECVYVLSVAGWEPMFFIKKAVEATGWESKEDNPELIRYLEGLRIEEASLEFPWGEAWIRPEDHMIFRPCWMAEVRDLELRFKEKVPIEDLIYPPLADYSTEELE